MRQLVILCTVVLLALLPVAAIVCCETPASLAIASPDEVKWSRVRGHNSIVQNRQCAGDFNTVAVHPYLDTEHVKRHALSLIV